METGEYLRQIYNILENDPDEWYSAYEFIRNEYLTKRSEEEQTEAENEAERLMIRLADYSLSESEVRSALGALKQQRRCCVLVCGVHAILDYLAGSYAEALRQKGYEVLLLDYRVFDQSMENILTKAKKRIDFVLAFNNVGFILKKKDGTNYWEESGIPTYDLLVDHPMYYSDTLGEVAGSGTILCSDRMHPAYVKRFYPRIGKCCFLPTAGTSGKRFEEQYSFSERPIDFLMIGSYKHRDLPEDPDALRIYRLLEEEPELTMEEAAERVFDQSAATGEGDHTTALKNYIEQYRFVVMELTAHIREKLLLTLLQEGYRIEVYGDGWKCSRCCTMDGFSLHPPIPVDDGITIMSQAKFVLNNMAWFKDGGSERVYNAMLQGALVVTDRSRYLEKDYGDDSLIYYDANGMNEMLQRIRRLMNSDGKAADEMREHAYRITEQRNRWIHRAEKLVQLHREMESEER